MADEQTAADPIANQETADSRAATSALGGPKEIAKRWEAFNKKGEAPSATEKPSSSATEKPSSTDKQESKQEKPSEASPAEIPIKAKGKSDKPVEKPTADDKPEPGTDGMSPEARKVFTEYKKTAEESKARLAELEKKIADGESTLKERDEYKKRAEDAEKIKDMYEAEVASVRVHKTAEYIKSVTEPLEQLMADNVPARDEFGRIRRDSDGRVIIVGTGEIPKLCKSLEIPFEDVVAALKMEDDTKADAKLSALMENMPSATARRFERMIDDVRKLYGEAYRIEQNAPKAWEAIQIKEKQARDEAAAKERDTYGKAFDLVMSKQIDSDPTLAKDDGTPTDEFMEVINSAKKIDFSKLTPDFKAALAQGAYLAIHRAKVIDRQQDEIAALKESIAKLSKRPGLSDGSPNGSSAPSASASQKPGRSEKPGDRFTRFVQTGQV